MAVPALKTPIFEGDVIVISYKERDQDLFIHALPPISDFNEVGFHSGYKKSGSENNVIPNIHFISFQVIPTEEGKTSSSTQKKELVYGRKIKLLHIASKLYLSHDIGYTRKSPIMLKTVAECCNFTFLPATPKNIIGDRIYDKDSVILESVTNKGHSIFCVSDVLTKTYALKTAPTYTPFSLYLHASSTNIKRGIMGGRVVQFRSTKTNAYLRVDESGIEAGARKKRDSILPRPLPVSGDTWWQLEETDNPLIGSPVVLYKSYQIKHLVTQKLLAVKDDKLIMTEFRQPDCSYDFVIISNEDNPTDTVNKGDVIMLRSLSEMTKYLSINLDSWKWATTFAEKERLGSKIYDLSLQEENAAHSFVISEVDYDVVQDMYYAEHVKRILDKYTDKLEVETVFDSLAEFLQVNENVTLIKRAKILRYRNIIDLIVKFLNSTIDKELCKKICTIMESYAEIPSHRCREYLARNLHIFLDKLEKDIGIEAVLIALSKFGRTAEAVVEKFIIDFDKIKQNIDVAVMDLLSVLCYNNGSPEKKLQGIICDKLIEQDENLFYWTKKNIDGNLICFKRNDEEHGHNLIEFCSEGISSEDKVLNFYIAQLKLFSYVCAGNNEKSVNTISKWFPFKDVLSIIKTSAVHLRIKSAYLKLLMLVYLDKAIEENGIDIDNISNCFLYKRILFDKRKGANVHKSFVIDLKDNEDITELLTYIEGMLKNHYELDIEDFKNDEFIYQILAVIELMVSYGYRWGLDNKEDLKIDLRYLVDLLDQSSDICIDIDNVPQTERRSIDLYFDIKIMCIKLLQVFFKQFIYLALEQFMYDFASKKYHIAEDLGENTIVITTSTNQYFSFPKFYKCFDIYQDEGQRLVDILLDLMSNENDELRASSAALLFDIYYKETIMFKQARLSYIAFCDSSEELYSEYLKMIKGENKIFQHLSQQSGSDEEVVDTLNRLCSNMSVGQFQTEMKVCSQNIAFSSGVFTILMSYVVNVCYSHPEMCSESQKKRLKNVCTCLQTICRKNIKIQKCVLAKFSDFLKAKIGISSIAQLLTEALTGNITLCFELSDTNINNLYTLVCSNYRTNEDYLEFFTTLEAAMKPMKYNKTGYWNATCQNTIVKMFIENYKDVFDDLMTENNMDQRLDILKRNVKSELSKLLSITNLLATCSEGHCIDGEDLCRSIFSQEELVGILVDEAISFECKVPFARLLNEAYQKMSKEYKISQLCSIISRNFWEHVIRCTKAIASLPDDLSDNVKQYIRELFVLHISWSERYGTKDLDDVIVKYGPVIQYFVEGIVPLVDSFCKDAVADDEATELCKQALTKLKETVEILINNETNPIFLTTNDQSLFWESFLNHLHSFLSSRAEIPSFDEDWFKTSEVISYEEEVASETKQNEVFGKVVEKNEEDYNEENVDGSNDLENFEEIVVQKGSSFERLVEKFSKNIQIIEDPNKNYKAIIHEAKMLLNVLKLAEYLTSNEMNILSETSNRTLKLLIGIIYVRTTINHNFQKDVEPVQNAFVEMGIPTTTIAYLFHPDKGIQVHILALLCILVFNSNRKAQTAILNLVRSNIYFFPVIHKMISNVTSFFSVHLVIEEEESTVDKFVSILRNILDRLDINEALLERISILLDLVSAMCDGLNRPMQNLLRFQKGTYAKNYNIVGSISLLLEALVENLFMIDNCTIVEGDKGTKIQELKKTCTKIITKAIQALIEMCAGNFDNQQVAVDSQVVDSINQILAISVVEMSARTDEELEDAEIKSVTVEMKSKAIELLEILLEETDKSSNVVINTILKEVMVERLTEFIKDIYDNKSQYKNHDSYKDIIKRNMFRAYHILRSISDYSDKSFADLTGEDESKEAYIYCQSYTHNVEINYIIKDKSILRKVYFPLNPSKKISDDKKEDFKASVNRDTPEDKLKDLIQWTKYILKNTNYKKKLKRNPIFNVIMSFPTFRHWLLILLTILLNIFTLALFQVPDNLKAINKTVAIVVHPHILWPAYHYTLHYILGVPHALLSLWMILDYLLQEKPNFVFVTSTTRTAFNITLHKFMTSIPLRRFKAKKLSHVPMKKAKTKSFEIPFFGIGTIYRIIFVAASITGLVTYGYFYSLCLPYIFIHNDAILDILRALASKAQQLILFAIFMACILLMYAVISFVFIHNFFSPKNHLFCSTLFQCYVTVLREGLLNSYGVTIPVKPVGEKQPDFDTYIWRSLIDISYFIIITVISLNVIIGIFVDAFNALRQHSDEAIADQNNKCFICGHTADKFEEKGTGSGFYDHTHNDHYVYSYVYYAMYVKSKRPQDHTAIEKYVDEKFDKDEIVFYPLRKAKVLQDTATDTAN